MIGEPMPLFRGELHPFPIIEPGFVLIGKLHSKGLVERALGCSDMGLKLDCVRSGIYNRFDIAVGNAEGTLMSLGYLRY